MLSVVLIGLFLVALGAAFVWRRARRKQARRVRRLERQVAATAEWRAMVAKNAADPRV